MPKEEGNLRKILCGFVEQQIPADTKLTDLVNRIQAEKRQLPLDTCRCQGLYYDNLGLMAICSKRTTCERYLQYETGRVFAATLCSPIGTINHFDCFIGDEK